MQADILRDKFLNFFKSKKHKIAQSDSLVPQDDPTVLFTPAGMNQFKKQFLGNVTDFTRAATSQRCLRTDDLDKVGKTAGHHTLFEMLGNFSFGDYFKEEAIAWAWEFLTEELKIKKDKLWVSVYKDDDQAYKIWKDKIKVPEAKIVKLGDKENFWPSDAKEKGPNGPCGPCSEIFFDFGASQGCKRPDCSPACDCGRFVEIWNLVFTQFNRKDNGSLEPLPQKNIDTGMGLERLLAVMEGAANNFETGLFQPLIKEIAAASQVRAAEQKGLFYAVSDHIRAVVFAIYDGIMPSNESRGYVIRKLIRKSLLHLRSLGIEKPFLYKLVPVLTEIMKRPYPELVSRREDISEVVLAEEKNFILTLNSSEDLLKEKFGELLKTDSEQISGVIAFQLYDTYGIPLELAKDWLDRHNLKFSQEVFDKELEEQKKRSKLTSSMKGEVFSALDLKLNVPATKFLGYKNYSSCAKILKIIKNDQDTKKIAKGDQARIILDQTSFYAESGGQLGDKGVLIKGKNVFEVLDTQKRGKVIVHIGGVKEGSFKKSDPVLSKVDLESRLAIARNHTATHLLQSALRKVLGAHVKQQGSLVSGERLRFDFTHFKDVSDEELFRIEELVNGYIIDNYALGAKTMPLATAKRSGALAFFSEKYEGKVRVVSIGDFSKEFCGGTHLDSTGQIGLFRITHEVSVASQVRRIEAVTGKAAYRITKQEEEIVKNASLLLSVPGEKIAQELQKKLAQIKELEKQVNSRKLSFAKSSVDELIQGAEIINNIKVICKVIPDSDMAVLRETVDLVKKKTDNAVICLGASSSGRALLVMGVTSDLSEKRLDASKLIMNVAGQIGGSGGGRKDFAQAGGIQPENFEKAFGELKSIISQIK